MRRITIALVLLLFGLMCTPESAFCDTVGTETLIQKCVRSANTDIALRVRTEEVLDTYKTFDGLLNGTAVNGVVFERKYKRLTFHNNFTQTPSTELDISATGASGIYIPELDAIGIGSVTTWRCNYKLY